MYHANVSNYKISVTDLNNGEINFYLNAKRVMDEYSVSHSTLYRALSGKKCLSIASKYKFERVRIQVESSDEDDYTLDC